MNRNTKETVDRKNFENHISLVHYTSAKPKYILWRNWQKIVAWCTLVVVLCAMFVIWKDKLWDDITPSHGFTYLGIRPGLTMRQNLLGDIVFDEDDIVSKRSVFDTVKVGASMVETIILAEKLYQLGNKAMVTSPCSGIYSVGTSKSSLLNETLPLYLQSVEIRNNKTAEYLREKYQILQPGTKLNLMLQAMGGTAEVAERKYYKAGNDALIYQSTKFISQNTNGILTADWSQLLEVKPDRYTTMTRAIPYTSAGYIGEGGANIPKINSTGLVYELAEDGSAYIPKYIDSAGREIGYEKTDQHLSYDIDDEKFQTIKSATVEYNADKGYYTVTMVADIEFKAYTTAETRWAITDSSATNDPHADFTKIEVKFELWDNGYFKKWEMRENWLAENAMPPLCFEMSAEQYYMEEFTYNEDDCDLTRFDFWNVQ